jgi:CheY-like chemotaxis protein
MSEASALAGRKILVVEDEFLIVDYLVELLESSGVEVIGPAGSIEKALTLIAAAPRIDGAMVDLNLRGEMSFAVADALRARGVPFAFTTGYDGSAIPERYSDVARYQKPAGPIEILSALLA